MSAGEGPTGETDAVPTELAETELAPPELAPTELAPGASARAAELRDLVIAQAGRTPWVAGKTVGDYRITGQLARGGFGEVYRAVPVEELGRGVANGPAVAIKRFLHLPSDREGNASRESFRCEGIAAALVQHPNVVQVLLVEEDADERYIVMELLEGETLARWSQAQRSTADVVRVVLQVLDGLEAMHRAGVVHRDITPSNLFVTETGEAKILDLGLASVRVHLGAATDLAESVSIPPAIVGTPGYRAPELWDRRPADERSDVWSVGAVLFQLLAGTPAFADGRRPYELPCTDGLPCGGVVERALQLDPSKRYPSASAMAGALGAALASVDGGLLRTLAEEIATTGVERVVEVLGKNEAASFVAAVLRGCLADRPGGDTDHEELAVRLAQALLLRLDSAAHEELRALLDAAKSHRGPRAWLRPTSATLAERSAALRARYRGHGSSPSCVTLGNDGTAASADRAGCVRAWKARDGTERTAWMYPDAIAKIELAEDLRTLLVGDDDGVVRGFDQTTGSQLWACRTRLDRPLSERELRLLALDLDGAQLTTVHGIGLIRIHAPLDGDPSKIVVNVAPVVPNVAGAAPAVGLTLRFEHAVLGCALVRGSPRLAVVVSETELAVVEWGATRATEVLRSELPKDPVSLVHERVRLFQGPRARVAADRADTDLIVAALSEYGRIGVFAAALARSEPLRLVGMIEGGDTPYPITSLAVSGRRLAAGCGDGSLIVFDVDDNQLKPRGWEPAHAGAVVDLAMRGAFLVSASADGTCATWMPDRFAASDARTMRARPTAQRPARRDRDGGEWVATAQTGQLELVAPDGTSRSSPPPDDRYRWWRCAAASSDGARIAGWDGAEIVVWHSTTEPWTVLDRCATRGWAGDAPVAIERMAFRTDGALVAIAREDSARWGPRWERPPHHDPPMCSLYVWLPGSSVAPWRSANLRDDAHLVAWLAPSGSVAVVAARDSVWRASVRDGEPGGPLVEVQTWEQARDGSEVSCVAASDSGDRVVLATGTLVEVWQVSPPRLATVTLDARVEAVAVEPDQTVVAVDVSGIEHRFEWVPPAIGAGWVCRPRAREDVHAAWHRLRPVLAKPPSPRLDDVQRIARLAPDVGHLAQQLELEELLAPGTVYAARCGDCDWGSVPYSDECDSGYETCGACSRTGLVVSTKPSQALLCALASDPIGVRRVERSARSFEQAVRAIAPQSSWTSRRISVWVDEPQLENLGDNNGLWWLREWLGDAALAFFDPATRWTRGASRDLAADHAWRTKRELPRSLTTDRRELRGLVFADLPSPFGPLVDIWNEGYGVMVLEPYVVLLAPT
ncbi:MAG: protein kinase [Deltaproteobacteria bacterium]|nr:protein kinase [Deltaproteobacteria bacterium]